MKYNTKILNRFWNKVKFSSETSCYEWIAGKMKGYGWFNRGDRSVLAHRFIYEIIKGAIPDNMVLDHICRNRACVNPDHLRIVNRRQNALENSESFPAKLAQRTHCPKGHPFSGIGSNVLYRKRGRICRTCQNEWARRKRAKIRLEKEHMEVRI